MQITKQEKQLQYQNMGLAQSMGFKPTLPPQYQQQLYLLMTYRSGIVPVQTTTYYTSDSGWGCMLRVAQMFIANLLAKEQYHVSKQAIIKLFYDNLMVPFSIQMITKASKQLFPQHKPYAWYTPCQAGFIVKDLLERFDIRYKVVICNDGSMFLNDIFAISDDEKLQTSNKNEQQIKEKKKEQQNEVDKNEGKKQQNIQQIPEQKQQIQQNKQNIKGQFEHPYQQPRIVVLLMARIGLDSPQPGYVKCITKFMQNKYFVSIMGGTPKRAHLFLQYYNGFFGFLDPHTTKPVVKDYAKVNQYMNEYTSKLQWINENKIDSSMCVGFCFLKSQTQLFWQSMQQLKQQLKQDFFIYMDKQRPQFDQNAIIEIDQYYDDDNGEEQQQQQQS